jgi:hypothetical protein
MLKVVWLGGPVDIVRDLSMDNAIALQAKEITCTLFVDLLPLQLLSLLALTLA